MAGRNSARWQKRPEEANEDWLITFSDMATLLLAFFVMLVSFSRIDAAIFEQVQSGLAKEIGKRDVERPIEQLKQNMAEVAKVVGIEDKVGIGTDDRGLTLEFPAGNFFTPGSAVLTQEAVAAFRAIAETLATERFAGFQVEVQGHTDDIPISTEMYPSNWELSASRATAVLRLFASAGVAETRLKAVGLAHVVPKLPNRDFEGYPIPENQTKNRRVVVRIYPR